MDTSGTDLFFGWDLLYKTVECNINKKADILIALVHFILTKYSSFRCIGVGEDKTFSEDETGSELLPDGWNDGENYALRYLHRNELFILWGKKTEDCIIINLMNVKALKVSNIALQPEELVKQTKGSINQMIPNATQLVERYRNELVEPVFTGTTRAVTTQTQTTPNAEGESNRDPLRIGEPRRPMGQFGYGTRPPPFGFPSVGSGDLDPLGRLGPGNLFEFPRRLDPRGSPGIGGIGPRFDPYGPPEANIRPNPNPDHFRPPDFGGSNYYL